MFKTKAFISERVWGYERWIASVHPAGQATVDAATEFIGGKNLSSVIGDSYPLLIKIIQANEVLSVQVHPDDDYARIHENSAGKTECWYILDAKPGASLIYGLSGGYGREELRKAIENNSLDAYRQSVKGQKMNTVSYILLSDETEARQWIARLRSGASFEKAAAEQDHFFAYRAVPQTPKADDDAQTAEKPHHGDGSQATSETAER